MKLALGSPALSFDCSAVVDHEVVELNWNQVYERRTLVLQFDSIENYTALPDDPVALSNSVGDSERLQANVAGVCRDRVFEILEWANRSADEGGPGEIAFPIIVDSDDRIASMYDMLNADGCSLWGAHHHRSSRKSSTDRDELFSYQSQRRRANSLRRIHQQQVELFQVVGNNDEFHTVLS